MGSFVEKIFQNGGQRRRHWRIYIPMAIRNVVEVDS
jgi:hypothetical protein